ncbi:MAG: zinc carboxypeptidase, partial [Candidatus Heimdallarchaeota archaeon]|nr:zinc carboxypeptidase [Candidatus Heimdallarchaeota archaeon]
MIIKKYSSKLIAVVFGTILLFGVSPLLSSARITVTIITPNPSEIDRTWDDLDLLYDNHFHNSSEVYEEIEYIHDTVPELVDLEVIGQTYLGKDIISLRITNENRPVQKAKTLVVSHHHGREQISIEIALRFVLYLLNNYQENDTITDFIDNQEIYVIPALNLDSLDLVINEDNHWLRKNLRPWDDDNDGLFEEDRAEDVSGDGIVSSFDVFDNTNPSNPIYLYTYYEGIDNDLDGLVNEDDVGYTDLNRNYDSYWRDGVGWSPDTESQVYPGPIPFSEPETRAFRDFALNHSFGMSYSLHSGINATYFADDGYDWAEPDLYGKMVQDYSKILPPSYTEMYTVYGQNTYPEAALAGGWDTWMYFERDCLAPITFELYRNYSSIALGAEIVVEENSTHLILEWKSIYDYFNPYPQYIDALWSDVRPGFDYLLDNTPRLTIIPEVLSGGYKLDDEVELSFNVTNLSPRIKTMDTIDLYTFDGTLLGNSSSINANSNSLLSFILTLPYDLGEEVYEIKLGNNFTGYYHFVLGRSSAAGLSIGPTILGVF